MISFFQIFCNKYCDKQIIEYFNDNIYCETFENDCFQTFCSQYLERPKINMTPSVDTNERQIYKKLIAKYFKS